MLEAGPRDNYLWIHIPDRLWEDDVPPGLQLGVPNRAGTGNEGTQDLLAARTGSGRIVVDQRPDLRPRSPGGLRRVGGRGQSRVGLARRAAVLHPQRGQPARGQRDPRRRWSARVFRHRREARIDRGDHAGAGELGVPRTDDFNGGEQEGVGYYQLFTKNGLRCSSSVGYLRPARSRANLAVEVGAQATRVLFDGVRATGVEYRQDGESKRVTVGREVILAAGSLQSPQLLQLSGIGPATLLRRVRRSRRSAIFPAWERTCRTTCNCASSSNVPSPLRRTMTWPRRGVRRESGCSGCCTAPAPLRSASIRADCSRERCRSRRGPTCSFISLRCRRTWRAPSRIRFSGFTMSVCQLRPTSRGHVRIKSADPLSPPAMQPNYLSTEEDDRRCGGGGRQVRAPARGHRGDAALRPRRFRPGPAATSDADLLDFARQFGATIFHPSGTCRMGSGPQAVVDDRLRVHGVASLRVVDCSIMPTPLGQHRCARRDDRGEGE